MSKTYVEHKRCGHCCKFMTSDCPYEHNVVGRNHGPAIDTFPCDKFIMKPWCTDKKEDKITVGNEINYSYSPRPYYEIRIGANVQYENGDYVVEARDGVYVNLVNATRKITVHKNAVTLRAVDLEYVMK